MEMFFKGWLEKLFELIARNPGLGVEHDLTAMNWTDRLYLYNWLKGKGNDSHG